MLKYKKEIWFNKPEDNDGDISFEIQVFHKAILDIGEEMEGKTYPILKNYLMNVEYLDKSQVRIELKTILNLKYSQYIRKDMPFFRHITGQHINIESFLRHLILNIVSSAEKLENISLD